MTEKMTKFEYSKVDISTYIIKFCDGKGKTGYKNGVCTYFAKPYSITPCTDCIEIDGSKDKSYFLRKTREV